MSVDETKSGNRSQAVYRTDEFRDSSEGESTGYESPEYEQNDQVIELIEEFFG